MNHRARLLWSLRAAVGCWLASVAALPLTLAIRDYIGGLL